MTSDTGATKKVYQVYINGNTHTEGTVKCGEDGIKPGYAIRVANGVAYLTNSSDDGVISGFAINEDGHDFDTAYEEGDLIHYIPIGQDTTIWAYYVHQSPAVTIKPGDKAALSATDGMVMATGTFATDEPVGRFRGDQTGSLTNNYLVKLYLGT